MKKIFLIIVLCNSVFVKAQQEVKIDIADAIVLKSLEFYYEYYISEQSSLGISAMFNFEKKNSDLRYNEKKLFAPYFRHYFTSNYNWNHFGEVFLGLNTGEKEIENSSGNSVFKKYTDAALGIAVGTKYISNGGFVLEAYLGLGRNMFSPNSYAIIPRLGINIGYRFQ
ncbi:MAG: DUF3575 domain-containing protein [Tenacibaculum sp.]